MTSCRPACLLTPAGGMVNQGDLPTGHLCDFIDRPMPPFT